VSNLCRKNSFLDIFSILKDADSYAKLTSRYCQGRVIWGSNSTVNLIRKLDCSPKCRDLIFCDRNSAAILNFDLINEYDLNRKRFFISALANDLFYADSQPCTSPSILFLISKNHKRKNILKLMKNLLNEAEIVANKKEAWELSSFSHQMEHLQFYAVNENQPIFLGSDFGTTKLAVVSNPTFQKRLFRTFEILIIEDFYDLSQNLMNKYNIFLCEGITADQKLFLSSRNNCTRVTSTGNAHQFSLIWDGIDTVRSLIRIPEIS
jgi:hypothetical protein